VVAATRPLPVCVCARVQPDKVVPSAENLGEHLMGVTIENSLYEVRVGGGGGGGLRCAVPFQPATTLRPSHGSCPCK
jgi:hypothetical protein